MTDERAQQLPAHVTTPLLTLITARSLDEDYAHVAARRVSSAPGADSPRPGAVTFAVVALFGLLTSVVLVQTSRSSEVEDLSRAALIEQINDQRAEAIGLEADVRALARANQSATVTGEAEDVTLKAARSRVARLEVRTGFAPVHGPGVRINVDSAARADSTTEIRDEDLATLVDGLWQAGAEAIAINGERINVLGGIRNTDRAVHVNGNPITAPYVVTAIGDKGALQSRLVETSQGQAWFALVNALGFRYSAENVDDVRLPGATLRHLREVSELHEATGNYPGEEGRS
jgi:uncharacterized protein YlxW (UPF0749 family)